MSVFKNVIAWAGSRQYTSDNSLYCSKRGACFSCFVVRYKWIF